MSSYTCHIANPIKFCKMHTLLCTIFLKIIIDKRLTWNNAYHLHHNVRIKQELLALPEHMTFASVLVRLLLLNLCSVLSTIVWHCFPFFSFCRCIVSPFTLNCIRGVTVSMFSSCAVDCRLDPRSSKTYLLVLC